MRNIEVQNLAERIIKEVMDQYAASITAFEDGEDEQPIEEARIFCGNAYLDCKCVPNFKTPYTPTLVFRYKGRKIYVVKGKKVDGDIQELEEILKTATPQAISNPYYF